MTTNLDSLCDGQFNRRPHPRPHIVLTVNLRDPGWKDLDGNIPGVSWPEHYYCHVFVSGRCGALLATSAYLVFTAQSLGGRGVISSWLAYSLWTAPVEEQTADGKRLKHNH